MLKRPDVIQRNKSQKQRNAVSIARKKSGVPWLIGKKHSEETRRKIGEGNKGKKKPGSGKGKKKKRSEEHRKKIGLANSGEKNHFWKGGITPINTLIKQGIEYRLWREAVFARDNWTCQSCGIVGGKLQSHHILSFSNFPHKRFDISNGITLCKKCHSLTDNYGGKGRKLKVN